MLRKFYSCLVILILLFSFYMAHQMHYTIKKKYYVCLPYDLGMPIPKLMTEEQFQEFTFNYNITLDYHCRVRELTPAQAKTLYK